MAGDEEECESVIAALNERLERHDENRRIVQESLQNACDRMRKQIDEMEESINCRLGKKLTMEENRLQGALCELRKYVGTANEEFSKAIDDAIYQLLVVQTYELVECNSKKKEESGFLRRYDLKTEKRIAPEWIRLKKPMVANAV